MDDLIDGPVLGLHHVALRTQDVGRTVGFYSALGYRPVHDWTLPRIALREAVMMQAPDGQSWLEIFDAGARVPMQGDAAAPGAPVATGALVHLCLRVRDVSAAIRAAVAAGGTLRFGPERLDLGAPPVAVENAIIDGTAGEVIELLAPVVFPGDVTPRATASNPQ